MEIKIGVGLEQVQFGLSIDEAKSRVGIPDKTIQGEDGLLLQYNSLKSTLWFNSDLRLHWIECSHPKTTFSGQKLIGQAAQPTLEIIESELGESWQREDYGPIESYYFNNSEVELQVEYAAIVTVCFGHLWKADKPIYPDRSHC